MPAQGGTSPAPARDLLHFVGTICFAWGEVVNGKWEDVGSLRCAIQQTVGVYVGRV